MLASKSLFGYSGSILFGLIVLLACLTTSVGLTHASANFFREIYPKISYKQYIFLFVVIGLLITNLGLNAILSIATPILVFIYPMAIVLILLSICQHFIGESKKMYRFSIAITAVFSVYSVVDFFNVDLSSVDQLLGALPLHTNGLGLVVSAIVASIVGYFWDYVQGNILRNK